MAINGVNGFGNVQFNRLPVDPVKPETRQKLKELGIDDKSIRTETQAQIRINEKQEEIKKQINEQMNAQAASQNQAAQAVAQPQQVQDPNAVDKVDGVGKAQQIEQPKGIEQQHALNNQQQGNEHVKAFASANAPQVGQQIQQGQPFELDKDLAAMYNKLKLGLI